MKAFLRELGCADSLDRPDINRSVADFDERKKNDMAYSRIALAMSMEDIVSSNLVRRSITPLKWIALTWQGGSTQVCQSLVTKNPQAIYRCDGRDYPRGYYRCPMHCLMHIRCRFHFNY
jgi:hypothetical protein